MIHLFAGYDKRESIGFHVFCHSVITKASVPVAIIPLSSLGMSEGGNSFTLSRFLIPKLMGFRCWAIFADGSDILMDADISELAALFDPSYAVQVVKHHSYKTRHRTKYVGTDMECPNMDYDRKNWASLMLINCEHPGWFGFRKGSMPEQARPFLQFVHCKDDEIGEIPGEWNRLVDEGQEVEGAKLLHWTAGIPGFPAYAQAPGSELWHEYERALNG